MPDRKYTTGKWEAIEMANGFEYEINNGGGWHIAVCCDGADGGDTGANANLIAAAPDLLEALEGLLEGYIDASINAGDNPEKDYWVIITRQAIKKAYGETP